MKELGKAVSDNVTLRSLSIISPRIHIDMGAFLKGITRNKTLERLHLDIKIGDKEQFERRVRSKLRGLIEIEFEDNCLRGGKIVKKETSLM